MLNSSEKQTPPERLQNTANTTVLSLLNPCTFLQGEDVFHPRWYLDAIRSPIQITQPTNQLDSSVLNLDGGVSSFQSTHPVARKHRNLSRWTVFTSHSTSLGKAWPIEKTDDRTLVTTRGQHPEHLSGTTARDNGQVPHRRMSWKPDLFRNRSGPLDSLCMPLHLSIHCRPGWTHDSSLSPKWRATEGYDVQRDYTNKQRDHSETALEV